MSMGIVAVAVGTLNRSGGFDRKNLGHLRVKAARSQGKHDNAMVPAIIFLVVLFILLPLLVFSLRIFSMKRFKPL